jgi:hypothetical protein
MPSLGEAPSVGARAFCLLLRSSKVSRRKGGTNSRRYLTNGYVHRTNATTPNNGQLKPPTHNPARGA